MIVVTTPTGQIGRRLLRILVEQVQPVRAIVRDRSRLDPELVERVDVVEGAHSDAQVVEQAFSGAAAVFWVVPPDFRSDDVVAHYLEFTQAAAHAIRRQGVPRVVGVSSLGRDVALDIGLVAAAYAMDGLWESTGVSYRALRMPAFMEDMLLQRDAISDGVFVGSQVADRQVPSCATRDIAAVAAGLLADGSWSGQSSVPVLGPEDLSFDEMAQVMTEVLGWPIRYRQVSPEEYRDQLMSSTGMSRAWAQGLVDNHTEASRGTYNADVRSPATGTPTSFRQWCIDELKPVLHR